MTEGEGADPTRPPSLRDRLAALPKTTVVAATAVIALIAAVVGLVFDLWPELKPDPRTQVGADLAVIAVERNVTLGEWLERSSGSAEEFARRRADYLDDGGSEAGLRIPGELAFVKVSVRGFKRRGISVRWAVYDAATQERVAGLAGRPEGREATEVDLEAPTDEFVAELWLGPVPGPRRYFVRVEAREGGGTLLAVADSDPFRGL